MKSVNRGRIFRVLLAAILIFQFGYEYNSMRFRIECHRIAAAFNSKKPKDSDPSASFDVNSYFQFLSRLKMVSGYQLENVLFEGPGGWKPFIYARRNDAPRFDDYYYYLASIRRSQTVAWVDSPLPHAMDFLQKVETDSSPEGYLQLLMLGLLGDKFSLGWHAMYSDIHVMCGGFLNMGSPFVVVTNKRVTIRLTTFGCISQDRKSFGGTVAVKEYILDKQLPAEFSERTIREYSGGPIFALNAVFDMMCGIVM